MRITYTAPVRAHHFNYAAKLDKAGSLEALVTGACRWSPRGKLPEIGSRLLRRDLVQTAHLLSIMAQAPDGVSNFLGRVANRQLDRASYAPATRSDVFLYYRTCGFQTTRRLKREDRATLCVMEEVNSHVEQCHQLMKDEYEKLGRGPYRGRFQDQDLRLQAYEEADFILCPSSFVRRSFIAKGFSEDRLLSVNFGFSHRPMVTPATADRQPGDTFRLLYVGQLNFRKGLRYAIEAFRMLKHPRKEFVIVGPETKVTGLEGLSMPEGVKFTGALKGGDLDAAYASASAFVLPTLEEGLALVLGEAMVAGLPVITTDHSGGDDLINDGVEGFILPAANTEALAEAFAKLADSPALCEQMGRAALSRSKELGDWDVAANRLISVLSDAISKRH